MVDRNIEHKKTPISMSTLKELGCGKISIASL
jgi:hypothetical protein